MDPLSTAASGIAIVSLTLQLIQCVDDINTCIRRVKDAPKELTRLTGRLERLGALLKDVHHLVQQRTAVQNYVGMPSDTISCCLRSCEESLAPLQSLVDDYTALSARNRSTAARIKDDIKFSMKTRDIVSIEMRIQDEIASLMSAVVVASATLQVSTLPYGRTYHSNTNNAMMQQTAVAKVNSSPEFCSPSITTRMTRDVVPLPLAWRWMGVSKWHSTRYIRQSGTARARDEQPQYEADEYFWNLPMFGRMLYWSQTRSCGVLTPSLTVFPLVQDFDQSVDNLLKDGTTQDFQRHLFSGALHPSTRDRYGSSLLHEAARYGRIDICHMLSTYGVRPDFDHRGYSPFGFSMVFRDMDSADPSSLDEIRHFLLDVNRIDDFSSDHWSWFNILRCTADVLEWMWAYSAAVLVDAEKLHFQTILLEDIVLRIAWQNFRDDGFTLLETAVPLLDPYLLVQVGEGQAGLLEYFISKDMKLEESQSAGEAFMELLQRLGVDAVVAIHKELSLLDDGIVRSEFGLYADKKAVFHHSCEQGWTLRFEYAFDGKDPSSTFMAEFTTITADADVIDTLRWPFAKPDYRLSYEDRHREGRKWELRHDRRMASKTRKELVRLGKKQSRSSMPGSWIH